MWSIFKWMGRPEEQQQQHQPEVVEPEIKTEFPESILKTAELKSQMAKGRTHGGADPSYRFTLVPQETKPE